MLTSTKPLLAVGLTLSVGAGVSWLQPTDVSAKYTTTPSSLRGKWQTHRDSNGESQFLSISKYGFYVNNFRYGRSVGQPSYFSGKRLTAYRSGYDLVVSQKSPRGYYSLGKNGTDAIWHLKKTRYHGQTVLKSWYYRLGDAVKPIGSSYYYHR
ncbi:hypothetical protein GCM10022296_12590 [Secundilactobacillus similis DSM 23365 = JCM 2765]|nr:hypothetical protein [Secundilactobacillus similis]